MTIHRIITAAGVAVLWTLACAAVAALTLGRI